MQDPYRILVEFSVKHLDFQLPELESVLERHKVDYQLEPLYHAEHAAAGRRRRRPFVILTLPCKDHTIGDILSQCVLVRGVMELWGMGESIAACAEATRHWVTQDPSGIRIYQEESDASKSWKVTIHTLGSRYSREEQEKMRKNFSFLDFKGDVVMKGCTNEFLLIREVDLDDNGGAVYAKRAEEEAKDRPPLAVYFGRVLNRSTKNAIDKYSLKKRSYLGPTSMDAELSFIMANLGLVRKGSVVLDPFVGTGSILVSCAMQGAYCVGTDIDIRVLRGKGADANVFANFRQYGLPRPELIRSDNAIYHRHFRSHEPLYDAIVTDPPYGIRAGARKSGSRLEKPKPVLEENRHDHIAQTKPYAVSDVMSDLLDVAARTLVMGGRLVYIIPSFSDFDQDNDLPRHDCLDFVHICYQPLSAELGRRMVSMKKVKEYDPAMREIYLKSIWKNGPESAEKCANIRDKLLEAAKKKPRYEEKAKIRKQKRILHKQSKKRARQESEGTKE